MSKALVLAPLLLLACTDEAPVSVSESSEAALNPDLNPTGRGGGTVHSWAGGSTAGSPIKYHGGPVMEGTVNVHYIWYGDWSGDTAAQTILDDMARSIGDTPYYKINTGYYDVKNNAKTFVSGHVSFAGETSVGYPYGSNLADADVAQVVRDALGATSANPNDLYFVLTSADVSESSGFCTSYCGWHWNDVDNTGNKFRYAFVGNAETKCPSGCMAQTTGPNGNAGADGMASVITHELEEANTDPDGNAWYDSRGYEDADKCAWNFGTTSTAANGAKYNVTWGARQFLVQQEWKVSGGCALK